MKQTSLGHTLLQEEPAFLSWLGNRCVPCSAPTGITRDFYLDLAERIVRTAMAWQSEDGLIIDPTTGDEPATATARFVGALGLLIGAGRCSDLLAVCTRSMDCCCEALATGLSKGQPTRGPEFFTKELVFAYRALKGKVSSARCRQWTDWLTGYDPWQTYSSVRDRATHNWPVYAITGEFLKQVEGLGDARGFAEDLLADQRPNFTEFGMYRDPNDPITYDLTVRQQLGLMLFHGYEGRHKDWVNDVVRKGGLATLLSQSVTGQAPFGGRSSQFHIQEGMIACICEMEARRYADLGKGAVAGAFKRAARRAALSTTRWILEMSPFRATKQGFAPALRHGVDSGEYSSYGLLAASLFATAWHLAEEDIAECLTPAETGGFVLNLWPAFHKVFASCGGYHVEIDTRADLNKDATGLGRLHRLGAPPELALSMPISVNPGYTLATGHPQHALALGPAWEDPSGKQWRLAQFSAEIVEVNVNVMCEDSQHVEFEVIYEGDLGGVTRVVEHYALGEDGWHYTANLFPVPASQWLSIPLLQTDGESPANFRVWPGGFEVSCTNHVYTVNREGAGAEVAAGHFANRNGIYCEGLLKGCLQAHLCIGERDHAAW